MNTNGATPEHAAKVDRAAQTLANDTISRRQLGRTVQKLVNRLDMTRAEAALKVGDAASQMSRLMTGHFGEFSADRLASFLVALGADVTVTIALPRQRTKRKGRVRIDVIDQAPPAPVATPVSAE